MTARWLRAVMLVHAAAQLSGGGIGFGWFPELVVGAPLDETGRLGFRLAGLTNLAGGAFAGYAAARCEGSVLRALAACAVGYHALAGAQALASIAAGGPLAAVGTSAAPFHGALGLALALAAARAR